MDERPSKRARRTDSAAMWEKNGDHTNALAADTSLASHSARDRDSKSSKPQHEEPRARHIHTSRPSNREDETNSRKRRRSRSGDRGRDRDDRAHEDRNGSPVTGKPDKNRAAYRARDRDVQDHRREDRSRSRERHRDRDRDGDAERKPRPPRDIKRESGRRSRSRSPVRNGRNTGASAGTTSISESNQPRSSHPRIKREDRDVKPSRSTTNGDTGIANVKNEKKEAGKMDVDEDDADALMRRMMGFSAFKTTQNTKVPGNQIYGVRKEKKTEYRQYMNRVGGFNRPLSPGR